MVDEPFGALDAKVRKELRDWLRWLHDEVHVTTVFVTHDQEEALEVADEIVVVNEGRVEQVGTPDQLYDEPGERLRAGAAGSAVDGRSRSLLRIGFGARLVIEVAEGPEATVVLTRTHARSLGLAPGATVWLTPAAGAVTSPEATERPLRPS